MITLQPTPATPGPDAARGHSAGAAVVRLDGPITVATAWKLVARVAEAVERGETRLLLDLTRVTALDPAGVAALLEAQRLVEQRPGGTLALHANRLVAGILTTSGTTGRFTLSHGAGM